MTAKQLITILEAFHPNTPVFIRGYEGEWIIAKTVSTHHMLRVLDGDYFYEIFSGPDLSNTIVGIALS